jgi:hypothetical protein
MVISILISGPFAYNQAYFKNFIVSMEEAMDIGGLELTYLGAEFHGPIGYVSMPGFMGGFGDISVPEEVYVDLMFRVSDGSNSYNKALRVRFNFASFIRGIGGIVSEPMVLDEGLGEYYIVVNPLSSIDLFYYYGSNIYRLVLGADDQATSMVYLHILIFIANGLGINSSKFIEDVVDWNPELASIQDNFMISVKYVPMVRLLWIASIILVIGEVLTILFRFKIFGGG